MLYKITRLPPKDARRHQIYLLSPAFKVLETTTPTKPRQGRLRGSTAEARSKAAPAEIRAAGRQTTPDEDEDDDDRVWGTRARLWMLRRDGLHARNKGTPAVVECRGGLKALSIMNKLWHARTLDTPPRS